MKPIDCHDVYRDGRHYDLQSADFVEDIAFYAKQIEAYGQPVLELACGTGRITIPLAEKGIRIAGLDVSEAMLARAREKAGEKGVDIDWIQADCRDFRLNGTFNLIFFPFNSITHLQDRESLEACLSCVKKHLTQEGRFIIDVFNPSLGVLLSDPTERRTVREYDDPDGKGRVIITESNVYDAATQINKIRWHYDIGAGATTFTVKNNMRIYSPQELDGLLHYNGFEIEAKYGNYHQAPFVSTSQKQIIICRAQESR